MKNEMYGIEVNKSITLVANWVNEDYDHIYTTYREIKNTVANLTAIGSYVESNTTEYIHSEYDCNGSVERTFKIKISKDNKKIVVRDYWHRNV